MRSSALKKAIIKTLAYSDLFDFPLSEAELWWRLQQPQAKFNSKQFSQALKQLTQTGRVKYRQDWYFLPGREKLYRLRKKREKISRAKWRQFEKHLQWFRWLPFIKVVAVTGALAVNNAQDNDDIDLLIITSSQRLWLSRLLLIGLTEILGVRRRPDQKQVADKICLNMFLTTKALKVPKEKQNLYTAYEVMQVKPVVNRQKTFENFLEVNGSWVKRFLPNFKVPVKAFPSSGNKSGRLLDLVDAVNFWLQRWYMRSRQTKELVTRQVAFFHPQDTRGKILTSFRRNYRRFLSPKRV